MQTMPPSNSRGPSSDVQTRERATQQVAVCLFVKAQKPMNRATMPRVWLLVVTVISLLAGTAHAQFSCGGNWFKYGYTCAPLAKKRASTSCPGSSGNQAARCNAAICCDSANVKAGSRGCANYSRNGRPYRCNTAGRDWMDRPDKATRKCPFYLGNVQCQKTDCCMKRPPRQKMCKGGKCGVCVCVCV
jgi:hypothetical protein